MADNHDKYSKLWFNKTIQHTPHVEITIQHEECLALYGIIYFNDKSVTFH